MELTIALLLSIIGTVISVFNLVFNRKDKSNKDTEKVAYTQGALDTNLKNIMDKLDKIEKKLDFYDKEIDERIEKGIAHHIEVYHKGK